MNSRSRDQGRPDGAGAGRPNPQAADRDKGRTPCADRCTYPSTKQETNSVTQCDVRHETGFRYRKVRDRVQQVADEVAPMVERITGMRLPSQPIIRLMTVPRMHIESQAHDQRILEQDIREVDLTDTEIAALRENRKMVYRRRLRTWVLISATTVISADGAPQILFPPTSGKHAGALGEDLYRIMAHELTHVAQKVHAPEFYALSSTIVPAKRGIGHLALDELLEGHAMWTDQQVTNKVFGRAPRHDGRSWFFHRATKKLNAYWEVRKDFYVNNEAFVTRVCEATGSPAALDCAWNDPDNAPTHDEIADPNAWLTRHGFISQPPTEG